LPRVDIYAPRLQALAYKLFNYTMEAIATSRRPPARSGRAFHPRGAQQARSPCLAFPLAPAEPLRPSSLMVLLFVKVTGTSGNRPVPAYPVGATDSSLAQSLASFISKAVRYPLRAKCSRWPGWREPDSYVSFHHARREPRKPSPDPSHEKGALWRAGGDRARAAGARHGATTKAWRPPPRRAPRRWIGSASRRSETGPTTAGWIDQDRKHTALKALQGMIWRDGYQRGAYTAHVYDDAAAKMKGPTKPRLQAEGPVCLTAQAPTSTVPLEEKVRL